MRHRSKLRLTARRVVVLLLAVSLIGLLLPTRLTGRLMNMVQVLIPLHEGATRLTDAASDALSKKPDPVSGDRYAQLERQSQALQNQLASLSVRLAKTEQENDELTGIRRLGLGYRGRLIPARIVGQDILSWRDSRYIDAGTLMGVADGVAVTTHALRLETSGPLMPATGMAVLQGETLIGWISRASTYTARVRLLSDPATRMPVTIGRTDDDGFHTVDAVFWLEGGGSDRIRILEVDHKYIKQGLVRKGDVVMARPDPPYLPIPLVIGRVAKVQRNSDNGLLYTITVGNTQNPLRTVYVLDMAGE